MRNGERAIEDKRQKLTEQFKRLKNWPLGDRDKKKSSLKTTDESLALKSVFTPSVSKMWREKKSASRRTGAPSVSYRPTTTAHFSVPSVLGSAAAALHCAARLPQPSERQGITESVTHSHRQAALLNRPPFIGLQNAVQQRSWTSEASSRFHSSSLPFWVQTTKTQIRARS